LLLIPHPCQSKVIIKHFYITSLSPFNGWDKDSEYNQMSLISGQEIVLTKTSLHLW